MVVQLLRRDPPGRVAERETASGHCGRRFADLTITAGDERVLLAARAAIKQGFREKSSLREQDEAAQSAIKHAEEVASMLRHNVVQGRLAGDNLYSK